VASVERGELRGWNLGAEEETSLLRCRLVANPILSGQLARIFGKPMILVKKPPFQVGLYPSEDSSNPGKAACRVNHLGGMWRFLEKPFDRGRELNNTCIRQGRPTPFAMADSSATESGDLPRDRYSMTFLRSRFSSVRSSQCVLLKLLIIVFVVNWPSLV
jgi:hypothetical protein